MWKHMYIWVYGIWLLTCKSAFYKLCRSFKDLMLQLKPICLEIPAIVGNYRSLLERKQNEFIYNESKKSKSNSRLMSTETLLQTKRRASFYYGDKSILAQYLFQLFLAVLNYRSHYPKDTTAYYFKMQSLLADSQIMTTTNVPKIHGWNITNTWCIILLSPDWGQLYPLLADLQGEVRSSLGLPLHQESYPNVASVFPIEKATSKAY